MDRLSPQTSVTGVPPPKRRCVSSPSADSPRELGQMRTHRDTGSGSAHFVGSGSGIHFVRTVRRAFASNSVKQNVPDKNAEEELVPGEDDRLNPPSTLWREGELRILENGFHQSSSTFDELVLWSKSYFDSWHPPFPFLHAPTVLGTLEKLSTQGFEGLDPGESVIVRSIMSISLADRRQQPENQGCIVPSQLVFHTTDEAIFALQCLIARPSSLRNLQAVVSVQLFLISMLRLNAASRIGGLIVRMALHLGLHRCPTRFEQFSTAEVDIRRRLFWSIYSIDRYLSQSLGLPLDLKDDDLDVCYHDRENHHSLTVTELNPKNASHLLLPTFLAKHGRIKGLILELRNKSILHSHFDPDEQARIDAEISQWWNAAQDLVDPIGLDFGGFGHSSQPAPVQLKSSHKLLLIVQKHESIILLNRPVISSSPNTSAFAAAMQKCIGASKAIVTSIFKHISSAIDTEGATNSRIASPLVWPGFIWLIWQSALILLYAASEGYYSGEVAQREASRCVAILEHLALRGTFWPSSCAAVIKELQSALNAKITASSSNKRKYPFSDTILDFSNTVSKSPGSDSQPQSLAATSNKFGAMDQASLLSTSTGRYQSLARIDPQHHSQCGISNETESPSEDDQQSNRAPATSHSDQGSRSLVAPHETGSNLAADVLFQDHLAPVPGLFPDPSSLGEFEAWDNMYGGLGSLGDHRDQTYDIFQLMDPSYLLSGQITPVQPPSSAHGFGQMPTNGQGHYQHS